MTKDNILIRRVERQDVPLLLEFIKGIARFAKMENEVIASREVLEREMFDEHRAEAVFAVVDGREVGFALYFFVRMAGISWKGLWKSIAAASGEDGTGAPVRTDGVDESRLE